MSRDEIEVGQTLKWRYKTGWGGGRIARTPAEVIKVNPKKIRIKVFTANGQEQIKDVYPESLDS